MTDSVAVETSTFNQRTIPNQEIRSPSSADAAKTSKAQASKDPISQSLSDSSPANFLAVAGFLVRPKRIRRYKKTTDSNHSQIVAPSKFNRKFSPLKPNEVWTSDMTYLRTREGWLYLYVWIDLYSRKVVGWSIANHMRASLVRNALQDALSRRPGTHPLVHSDCGSQYASTELRTILWRHRLRQSLSRKGDCWDNAPTESFFGTLKQQLDIYCLRPSATLKDEIIEYIEIFYNRRRLHSSLGYKAPEEFDNEYWSVKAAS